MVYGIVRWSAGTSAQYGPQTLHWLGWIYLVSGLVLGFTKIYFTLFSIFVSSIKVPSVDSFIKLIRNKNLIKRYYSYFIIISCPFLYFEVPRRKQPWLLVFLIETQNIWDLVWLLPSLALHVPGSFHCQYVWLGWCTNGFERKSYREHSNTQ